MVTFLQQIQIASIHPWLSPLKLYQDTQHVKLAGLWLLIIITQKSERELKYAGHKGYAKTCSHHGLNTTFVHSFMRVSCLYFALFLSHSLSHTHLYTQSGSATRGPLRWSGIQHGFSSCLLDMQWERSGPARQELHQRWWGWASGPGPSDIPPLGTEKRMGGGEQDGWGG